MQKIRDCFHETVGMAVLDERAAVGIIAAVVQETGRFGFTLCAGHRFPIHTGAPAKAILAYFPAERLEPLLRKTTFRRFTETTLTSRRAFQNELAEIRGCGYALDRAEEVEGCHCIAVPVFDRAGLPVAGVWFTGPSNRLPLETLPAAYPKLRALVNEAQRNVHARQSEQGWAALGAEKIERARQLIETTPLAEELDFIKMACTLGMSYSAFRHAFKAQVGTPPAQFRLSRRIAAVCHSLEASTLSLSQIAEQVGFPSAAHFSTIFKKKTGVTPRNYRAGHRRG